MFFSAVLNVRQGFKKNKKQKLELHQDTIKRETLYVELATDDTNSSIFRLPDMLSLVKRRHGAVNPIRALYVRYAYKRKPWTLSSKNK